MAVAEAREGGGGRYEHVTVVGFRGNNLETGYTLACRFQDGSQTLLHSELAYGKGARLQLWGFGDFWVFAGLMPQPLKRAA